MLYKNEEGKTCYVWLWKSGGFNTMFSDNIDSLQNDIAIEFPEMVQNVKFSTIRPITKSEYDRLHSNMLFVWQ